MLPAAGTTKQPPSLARYANGCTGAFRQLRQLKLQNAFRHLLPWAPTS